MTSGDPGETGATNRLGNEATTGQSETGDPDPAHAVHESQTVFGDVEPRSAEASRTGSSATDSMADLDEFKRVLIELGIIGSDELGAFEMDPSSGVLGLARVLVRAGRLTSYQSAAIYQKKSRGLLIGRYLILDKLGQGGMGVVFKAQKRKTGKIVALKILPPSFARDQQAVARFKREIEAAGRLNHPNIVAALDADEDRGVHLLVMDYVDGRDLDRIVQTRGPLPVVEAVDCLIQAARGLEAAHAQGIVHRDIKPGNLMLDAGGNVRVLDLGLARIVEAANPFGQAAGSRLTQSGMYMGTIDYMAPEQAEDSRRADHRADIYSLGCTLHYLLTGREPFEAETILKRLLAHQERPAPKLRAARPDAPPALEAVFQKMMAKRPADRPATMTELIALLESCKALAAEGRAAAGEAPKSRPELKVFDEPLKRAAPAKTKAEPSIFTVLDKTEGPPRIKEDLRLEDLVMDVRPETPPAPLPASPRTRRTVIENPRRAALAPSGRRRSVRSRPPWLWPAVAAGALVCGLLISWINGVFKVRTKDGLIVLENVPENAVVEVDGERVTLTPHDGKPITIEAHPGKHGVVVKRDDVVLMGEDVSLEAGKEIKLTVRLEPVAGSGSTPAAAEVTSQPAGAGSTALLDRSRFDVLAGQWQVENNELVQKDLTRWYNSILFGDDQWTDYDFSVDAMRIGGGNSFSLVFRAGNRSDFYKYVIGGEGNTRSSVVADEGGQTRSLKILDFRFGIRTTGGTPLGCTFAAITSRVFSTTPVRARIPGSSTFTTTVFREAGWVWRRSSPAFGSRTSRSHRPTERCCGKDCRRSIRKRPLVLRLPRAESRTPVWAHALASRGSLDLRLLRAESRTAGFLFSTAKTGRVGRLIAANGATGASRTASSSARAPPTVICTRTAAITETFIFAWRRASTRAATAASTFARLLARLFQRITPNGSPLTTPRSTKTAWAA